MEDLLVSEVGEKVGQRGFVSYERDHIHGSLMVAIWPLLQQRL